MSAKIEPLIHRGIPLARSSEEFGRIIFHVEHEIHDREEFTALVRWGAAALAQTHPRTPIGTRPLCAHESRTMLPHTDGKYEGEMCNACGELLRAAAPTDAEGAE